MSIAKSTTSGSRLDNMRRIARDFQSEDYYAAWKQIMAKLPERAALRPVFVSTSTKDRVRGFIIVIREREFEFRFKQPLKFQ